MQAGLFQPPPAYMDSEDYVYSHGIPAQSHLTPLTNPLDPSATNPKTLASQRRIHVRRLYDLLQLMLLRRDTVRATRCLRLLMYAPEWRPLELWKLGLEVASMPNNPPHLPLRYLQHISRTRTVLAPRSSSVIASYPYRHNPQLHTYLGLLTLFLGTRSLQASSASTPSLLVPTDATRAAPPHVCRAAQLHFENAVKVANRYTGLQNMAYQHRMRMHQQRQGKLARAATAHRDRMWRLMRDDGWIFGEEDEPKPSAPRTSSEPASDRDTDVEDEPVLPHASYFSLESDVESGFDSDTPASPDAIVQEPEGPVEGPDAPPVATRASASEMEPDTFLPPLEDSSPAATLTLPSVQWSMHVAQLYLELVRCMLTQMAQSAPHAPPDRRIRRRRI